MSTIGELLGAGEVETFLGLPGCSDLDALGALAAARIVANVIGALARA